MMPQPPLERTPDNAWPQWPRVLKTDYGQQEAIACFGSDPRLYQTTVKEYIPDEQGNLKSINGRKEDISRNKQGLIESYSLGENGLTSFSFTYDADSRVKKSSKSDADSGTDNYTYKYNAKGFVSSRYCKGEIMEMGADEPITYEENVTYDYTKVDEQGNWTKRTCHGATGRDPWTETRTIIYY